MRFLSRSDDPPPVRIRRRRKLMRRALLGAISAVVLGAALGGTWYLERSGRLPLIVAETESRIAAAGARLDLTVASVQVEGRLRADPQAILSALRVARGTPILGIDLDAAKTRLEAVPWIRSAAIERLLPDTLFVRVTERAPLALWQHGGKFDLIDQDGAVIANADPAAFPALLQVVGDGAPAAAADLLPLLGSEPSLRPHVAAAIRVGGRRWNIRLDNGIDVALPENGADRAWHRLAALERSDNLLQRNLQAIDLRLNDRVVLRLPPEVAKSLIKKGKHSPASPNT